MSFKLSAPYNRYEPIEEADAIDEELPPSDNIIIHPVSEYQSQSRWNHLEDLDEFFSRIYQYVQRAGFISMLLQDILQILVLWYIVIFPTFLLVGVDFDILFDDKSNITKPVFISDAVLTWTEASKRFNSPLILTLIIVSAYLFFRTLKSGYNILKYWEMRAFFMCALSIHPSDLKNKTWHEVQSNLIKAQQKLHMCIHKNELTQLDICHRILRFKNYSIAMVNKSLLPIKFDIPAIGNWCYYTSGLKYNFEMILFWGPGAPFENNWQLRSNYKNIFKRKELANELSKRILIIGLINLIFSPVILIWTMLYIFFEHFALFRNDPSLLGTRRWSQYGRHFFRHFNELDHDFNIRLCRGYRPAQKYMNLFISPILTSFSQFVIVISSGILGFLIICTIRDQDTLAVNGIIGLMTVLGIIVTIARTFIPDENLVNMPETLLTSLLCQMHYMPASWMGQAHTTHVRHEFSQLFQYKLVYLLEEMLSAIFTPLILIFCLRPRSTLIVDFLRNYTVHVEGVGDVCSFAQMDIRKHGGDYELSLPPTNKPPCPPPNEKDKAEFGKTELSLIHFTLTNPEWKVPEAESHFINSLRQNIQSRHHGRLTPLNPATDPLLTSSQALSLMGQPAYCSLTLSTLPQMDANQLIVGGRNGAGDSCLPMTQGGMMEGSSSGRGMGYNLQSLAAFDGERSLYDETRLEQLTNEMSYSALYLFEQKRLSRISSIETTNQLGYQQMSPMQNALIDSLARTSTGFEAQTSPPIDFFAPLAPVPESSPHLMSIAEEDQQPHV